ncbi:TPM domain-containing protein [Geobacter sp. SVR]|uniref:TPM domain-containing protein n=1 Tax=Geobacter sp. SVR TaxID=2495594 RepID=UPI00143EF773|nr:hypothetical protein [Geobacter sp. SVR]BCS53578.1 hypothetical protein GSVR_18860 [Geobacter sp. SVR]GCF84225.1 hypothetical protein GSbR_08250 [Geobacter sp. SVR]
MTNRKARDFFSDEERERIRLAVELAESGTAGEIAPMVVDRSDRYREAEVLGGVLLSGLVSIIVAVAARHEAVWTYVPLVFALYFPCRNIFKRFPHLKLPFLSKWRTDEAVRERALRAFYEKRLHKTSNETGILIFISLLEHKVWILGDRGINARIAPHFWHRLAAELAAGLKEDRACDALCNVIAGCGKELAHHFPRQADDRNELDNNLIR